MIYTHVLNREDRGSIARQIHGAHRWGSLTLFLLAMRQWRIIVTEECVYMLLIYRKSRQEDLTQEQLRVLRKLVKENLK